MLFNKDRSRQLQWRWRLATAALRALPDLVILGAQKAGTTSLFHYLGQHPEVIRPFRKEVHFFDHNFEAGPRWYRAHFPLSRQLEDGRITFEASPLYLFHPLSAERMAGIVPKAKLIAILRDPVERAISHYFMERRKGRDRLPLRDALAAEEQRLAGPIAERDYAFPGFAHFSYKSRGHYAEQLERYRAVFPAEQLLVLGSDDLFDQPEQTLRRVFEFAGVDPSFTVADLEARNTGHNRTEADPGIVAELEDYFRPHNERLYRLIGRNLGWGGE
jgi:hypothetical protein